MGEPWAAAVAAAGEAPPADLPAAVAEELIALWSDLCEAQRAGGRPVLAGRVRRAGRADRHADPAHHGHTVAVDTDAPADQRRLSGHPAVRRCRMHPAGHRRDSHREPGPAVRRALPVARTEGRPPHDHALPRREVTIMWRPLPGNADLTY